jgi:hypothetical protein
MVSSAVPVTPHIRSDLARAHDEVWDTLGRAGTHLTGDERVAVMDEARKARNSCDLCRRRKAALSPFAIDEAHEPRGTLSADEVDAVHRIASDPGRLSKQWFDSLSVTPERYVELLSVTAHTVGIDSFHRGVGLSPRPLPAPQTGEPSGERPRGPLDHDLAWVPVRRMRGVPNIVKTLSLVPGELRTLLEVSTVEYVDPADLLVLDSDHGRQISRTQIELVAGRVSAQNECFY